MDQRIFDLAKTEAADPSNHGWWWLSFADGSLPVGTQFLGAVLIEANGFGFAVMATHLLGINPGGEVQAIGPAQFPADEMPHVIKYAGRLMNRSECEQFDAGIEEIRQARRV